MNKNIVIALVIVSMIYPVAEIDRVNYGNLYIKNETEWDLKVKAQVKDEWNVITQTNWDIPVNGTEKLDNLVKLDNIYFWPDIDDESNAPAWLKVKNNRLRPKDLEPVKDLYVTISKNPYQNAWNIVQRYVVGKTEPGGETGYNIKVLAH